MSGPEIKEVSAEEEDRRKEWLEKTGEDKGERVREEREDTERMEYIR